MKKNKNKITITTGSPNDFFGRVRENASRLDNGESIVLGTTIMFEDPLEMLNVLTYERVRLLRTAKKGALPIASLASELDRDLRAVSRDVVRLEKAGLLRTSYRANPGHGRCKIVEPVAREYLLSATI
jgi:predicted transcriptional regulator